MLLTTTITVIRVINASDLPHCIYSDVRRQERADAHRNFFEHPSANKAGASYTAIGREFLTRQVCIGLILQQD
jgi:hypothetical protein